MNSLITASQAARYSAAEGNNRLYKPFTTDLANDSIIPRQPSRNNSIENSASSGRVMYTVSNNITVNTDERSGKAVENAASYVFLRGVLNPKSR